MVAGGTEALDPKAELMLQEAYRHHKTVGGWGSGVEQLAQTGITDGSAGVVVAEKVAKPFTDEVIDQLGRHRHWER